MVKKVFVPVLLIMLLCGVSFAETINVMRTEGDHRYDAFDYEDITVSTTSIGLTLAKYNIDSVKPSVQRVVCYNDLQPIRFRLDGTAPTASVGIQMNDKDTIIIEGYTNIADFRAIRQGGTDSTLRCQYFR